MKHFCYICDSDTHPLKKCTVLKLPKPEVFVAGPGNSDTMFSKLPDIVYKAELAPAAGLIALVRVSDPPATAKKVESQVVRVCPVQSSVWEAIPNGENSFTISFPLMDDLLRFDGIDLGIPATATRLLFSQWKPEEIKPKLELHQTWFMFLGFDTQ
jgi:hypothetical protein